MKRTAMEAFEEMQRESSKWTRSEWIIDWYLQKSIVEETNEIKWKLRIIQKW